MTSSSEQPDLRVYPDLETLSRALAEAIATLARQVTAKNGRFTLALAGGNTPVTLYEILARDYRETMPWGQTHLFWGDDRFVPHDDPSSNYRMARKHLLQHVPIVFENVHPMPTYFADPREAAADYEATLKEYFTNDWPCFDLALQGMGDNGHTASIFPGSPALTEKHRWVMAVETEAEPPLRLTVTLPVLNNSRAVYFLVSGADKGPALRLALREATDPQVCPAAGVRPAHGQVVWWVDQAAVDASA